MRASLLATQANRALVKDAAIAFGLMALALAAFSFFGIDPAHAQLIQPDDAPQNVTDATGGATSFRALAKQIINFFLYFLGFVATVMIIYGGILYVTSAGNEDNTGKAKKILLYAILGIVVILVSFAIVNTVLQSGTGTAANT